MPDSKTAMLNSRTALADIIPNDIWLKAKFESGIWRRNQFGKNWQRKNLNKAIERFAPNSKPYFEHAKLIFQTPGLKIRVVVDLAGFYFRIEDTSIRNKIGKFLDYDGNKVISTISSNGKQVRRSDDEIYKLTHFTIMTREEMENE